MQSVPSNSGAEASREQLHWLTTSPSLRKLPAAQALLGAPVSFSGGAQGVLAWGHRPSSRRASLVAKWFDLPLRRLEDGFVRSFAPGQGAPALSLVADDQGIYYDSTQPTDLEALLESNRDLLAGRQQELESARELILLHRISKYNHAPPLRAAALLKDDQQRVLVVDQTRGDLSVKLGGADHETFTAMLAAAKAENPRATIYIKTHPEVASGHKRGYLSDLQSGKDKTGQTTVLLREPVNPLELVEQMDRVYVVTSTLGFEALLAGKPVTCFGIPWYAGWGVTDDRQTCARRTRKRTVLELFAAAYVDYARYLNPTDHSRGSLEHVIEWILRQRDAAQKMHGSDLTRWVIGVGMPRWRQHNLRPMLGLQQDQVTFAASAQDAQALDPRPGDTLLCWGGTPPAGLEDAARGRWARLLHMEDGFIRSVGLGSDLIRPLSLVFDERGIYFDATRPSDLEHMLNHRVFTEGDQSRARAIRSFIVSHEITKYNLEPSQPVQWPSNGRLVVLVTGQVEGDASIRLGCTTVRTNLQLLRAVRQARPDAFIVYKPHPDVLSRNRHGVIDLQEARQYADHIEAGVSVVSCIQACDEVHTMTSLSGFDALLRGKRVVTYGQPFYAGWGLTEDRAEHATAFARRERRLSLDELVAGALLHYPIYWDWTLMGYTTCEAAMHQIVVQRDAMQASGDLRKLQHGWGRRQFRRLATVWRAWTKGE